MHARTTRTLAWLIAALCLGAATPAFADPKLDRLTAAERVHFDALRVWMEEPQIKAYLKLKTEAERNAWLRDNGLWDRFYKYDERQRQQIDEGRVAVGWTQDMVFMAWGPPHQRTRNIDPRVAGKSETMTYRFEVTEDGRTLVWAENSKETHNAQELFRYVLLLHNGAVVRVDKAAGWD
jgi:hypothetical protein